MPRRLGLPREGLTLAPIMRLFQKTALNPVVTLLLLLFAAYTPKGRELALTSGTLLKRVRILFYVGLYRWANSFLSWGVVNNWQSDKYDWAKEIVVVTGGSGGIGSVIVKLLAERGIKVAVLDVMPLTFEARTPHLTTSYSPQADPIKQHQTYISSSATSPQLLLSPPPLLRSVVPSVNPPFLSTMLALLGVVPYLTSRKKIFA